MMNFVFLSLLLQSSPAQESNAEKLYRSMEERLTTAKTLQFTFKWTLKAGKPEAIEGSFLLGEGNRLKFDLEFTHGEKKESRQFISDGKTVAEIHDGKPRGYSKEVPSDFGAIYRLGIARAGPESIQGFSRYKDKEEANQRMRISDFKLGGREKIGDVEAEIVEYSVEIPRVGKAAMRVWIDPKTLLPLRRTTTATRAGETFTATITYGGFKVDEKIDDSMFKLP